MSDTGAKPFVVFGKLAGAGLLLLGLAGVMAAIGTLINANTRAEEAARAYVAEKPVKRDFLLMQLGEFRRDQFLVDKESGRVWQSVCSGEVKGPDCDGMLIWDEMYVDGVTPSTSNAARNYLERISGGST